MKGTLFVISIVVIYVLLNMWVLPKFGINT
jgi:hypothetical protein